MAVLKSGILGGVSGSIGNVTGSSWKGISVLRTKPLSVANPNTPAQQAVRTPWASLTKLGSSITGVILQPVWNGIASKMSGYNMFLQKNAQLAFSSLGDFLPMGLSVSPGTLPSAAVSVDELASTSVMSFNVATALPSVQALSTDKLYAVVVDSDGIYLGSVSGTVTRTVGAFSVIANRTLVNGERVYVYAFFVSADGKRIFAQSFVQGMITL